MIPLLNLLMRLLNGFVTLYFAPSLYTIYAKTTRRFYLYWSLGYAFYGLSILVRLFAPTGIEISTPGLIAFFLIMVGFVFMVTGVGQLIERKRLMLASTVILLIPVLQLLFGTQWVPISLVFSIFPYLFMAVSLILIQYKWKVDLRLLIAGWLMLFLVNLGFFVNLIDTGFVDLLSLFSKVFIFWGMTQPSFSFLVDDLRVFLIGGLPSEYSENVQGRFNLLNLPNAQRDREIQWIRDRVDYNSRKGIRTVLVTLYDMITTNDILNKGTEENLYFVRVLSGSRSMVNTFEQHIMTINDDLNQMDLLFSDIINSSNERRLPCEIILYSFSHLILTHGWKRVYSFIMTKTPLLKSSSVTFTAFYYPKSHENPSDIAIFEKLADKVLTQ